MSTINQKWILASTMIFASLIGAGFMGMSSSLNAHATSSSTSSIIVLNSGADKINASANTTAPQYIGLGQATTLYADNKIIIPLNGTLSNLYAHVVLQNKTQTSGAAWTFTVVKTNSLTPTTLTCSTPLTGPAGSDTLVKCSDTTHSVPVTAGDMFVVSAVANDQHDHDTRAQVSFAFTPQ